MSLRAQNIYRFANWLTDAEDASAYASLAAAPIDYSVIGLDISDTVPGNASTTFSLSIGSAIAGSINTLGDSDWFRVSLTAGQTYSFALNGAGGTPLSDPTLTLYNAAGAQVAYNDDGGPGTNSLLTFTATASGTYFIGASAYNSSYTGQYELVSLPPSLPGPLSAIDWGTVVTLDPGRVIQVYFAPNGESYGGATSTGWTIGERDQAMLAFSQFSEFINVNFVVTDNAANAEFILLQSTGGNPSLLGWMNPPGETNEGVAWFNDGSATWTAGGLAQGGYGFETLIHEFGHGLGLAHPHDNGGTSDVMNGVSSPFGDYGDYNLNQGVFTMMSYNSGWELAPHGVSPSLNYGYEGTPMALDIAVLQARYGANTTFGAGANAYTLPGANGGAATFYSCIWDTGGIDTIQYGGALDATIDLRAATLLYAAGGGGFVSYVEGVHGGYTIANGVVIENATGGAGDDTLFGNNSNNTLRGNAGADLIQGFGGNDVMGGGDGIDTLTYGNATAGITINLGLTTAQNTGGAGADTIAGFENLNGSNHNDALTGGAGANIINGAGGNDSINGGAGVDLLSGGAGDDVYTVDSASDVVNELLNQGTDLVNATSNFTLGAYVENLNLIGAGATSGTGNQFANIINGNAAANRIDGGGGADSLHGGAGNDQVSGGIGDDFVYGEAGADTLYGDGGVGAPGVAYLTEGDFVAGSAAITFDNNGAVNPSYTVAAAGLGNVTVTTGGWFVGQAGGALNGTSTITLTDRTPTAGLPLALDGGANTVFVTNDGSVVTSPVLSGSPTFNGPISILFDQPVAGVGLLGGYFDAINSTYIEAFDVNGNSLGFVMNSETGQEFFGLAVSNGQALIAGISFYINSSEPAGFAIDNLTFGAASSISAFGGDDWIDGGLNADRMIGGGGNDTYIVDNSGDIVQENANEGIDTVRTSVAYTLAANVENIILTGSSNLSLNGNYLNNVLTGNAGNNVLNGGGGDDRFIGGAGADTMNGGLGNDIYAIDSSDTVTETLNAGTDTVRAAFSYALGANVENLELLGGAIIGTGNGLSNSITGTGAANTLNGGGGNDTLNGGVGADIMNGGLGDDVYYVDNAGDLTNEGGSQGQDRILSAISRTLANNVEDLTLLGTGALTAVGNNLANTIIGNSGANLINGLAGWDTLMGGAGADSFVFNTALASAGVDTILDFNVADDTIRLDNAIFTALGASTGFLSAGFFYIGATANDADDRIIYNSGTGALLYDANGDAAGGVTAIARLAVGLALTENDFYVI
jgi:Ca2+-binding RTX toxin-like protein